MAVVITEEAIDQVQTPHHTRFSELPWYDPSFGCGWITIGGAGGIGSWLAVLLSRAGYVLQVWDHDLIEDVNFAGQLYTTEMRHTQKSEAVVKMCKMLGAEQMLLPEGKFIEGSTVSPITFAAFDNMAARKLLFESWVSLVKTLPEDEQKKAVFIDGRMLAEAGHIYWVTIDNADNYRTQLFDDKTIADQPCSAKATSFCGAFISSVMTSIFSNWVTNVKLDLDAREVPFKFEFELPLLNFTTKIPEQCMTS